MRENMGLYRGKWVDNGEWVEGHYARFYDGEKEKYFIFPGYADFDCGEVFPERCEVDPATVGQFTGLVDKNGVKVFEGDIVEFSDCIFRRMEWCQDKLGFVARCGDPDLTMESLDITADKLVEVVGNIHDNPELLEVTQ